MPKDTKTRYQGVYARHQRHCRLHTDGKRCNCTPKYWGAAWDRVAGRNAKTKYYPTAAATRAARADLVREIQLGNVTGHASIRYDDAVDKFLQAVDAGTALNKKGLPYKHPNSTRSLRCLRGYPMEQFRTRLLSDIRRGDVQKLIDKLSPTLSGSRIRSIVNSIRALYAWAEARDYAMHDPAHRVRLPAMAPMKEVRVITGGQFKQLLDAIPDLDVKLAFALAGYHGTRNEQTRRLDWGEVDTDTFEWCEFGKDPLAAKSDAAHRFMPLMPVAKRLLRERWERHGRPTRGLVLPPVNESKTGLRALDRLQDQADRAWQDAGLERITFQECRHSCSTWLDAAGAPPRLASMWMGHTVPKRNLDAAPITLQRYTHGLQEDLEGVRDKLVIYLERSEQKAREHEGREA